MACPAQDEVDAAAASIRHAVGASKASESRAEILAATVEILRAAGDVSGAQDACAERDTIATSMNAPYLFAVLASARVAVFAASGDAESALIDLRAALHGWERVNAPDEAARVRISLAAVHRSLGDEHSADMEISAAHRSFTALGAVVDLNRIAQPDTATHRTKRDGSLTAREVDIIAMLATGRTNRAIAESLGISEKTVARHVANIFSKLNLTSLAAATAYAYEHGLCRPNSAGVST